MTFGLEICNKENVFFLIKWDLEIFRLLLMLLAINSIPKSDAVNRGTRYQIVKCGSRKMGERQLFLGKIASPWS